MVHTDCRKYNLWIYNFTKRKLKEHPISTIKQNLLVSYASSINTIGLMHEYQGDIPKAISYYHKSLDIREEIGDKRGVAKSLNSIGGILHSQGDFSKAIKYYRKSINLFEGTGDKEGIANGLYSIGSIHHDQGNLTKAISYYHSCLYILEEIGHKEGIASSLNNIGLLYYNKGDISKAKIYYHKSLKIHVEIGDKEGISVTLNNIGDILLTQGKITTAKEYLERSLNIARGIGYPESIKGAAVKLSKLYEIQGKGLLALEMYQLYITMRDSIKNENSQKATALQQAKYQYEKQKAIDDAEHDKLLVIEQEEKEKQQILTGATSGGLGLVAIFLLFVFNRLRVTKKQKSVIEAQKQEVEQQKEEVEAAHQELEKKNQEIMDSITYAKRIQSAILPTDKVVKEYLKESFILYKPKNIVAGDFYWMESVAPTVNNKESLILFAAADCTGHGIPGAMISVVCNNALNRSVREYGLTDVGAILDKTREIVIQEFEKSDEEVNDGMDIALCSLKGHKLHYAGAHNPLWIIRNGEIIETKANKQPISQFDNLKPYTTHSFDLQEGDSIYIFSDGYVDQFGGKKGKKFKTKAFRTLLLSIQDKPMEEQKVIIDDTFETWRGGLEQIDDVCIIGVRV